MEPDSILDSELLYAAATYSYLYMYTYFTSISESKNNVASISYKSGGGSFEVMKHLLLGTLIVHLIESSCSCHASPRLMLLSVVLKW